jgi:hypothetical protein
VVVVGMVGEWVMVGCLIGGGVVFGVWRRKR